MTSLALHELHSHLGAHFAGVNGFEVVEHYGDSMAEYTALRETAGVLDLSFRGCLCLAGADRVRFLNGQVTNNVKDLGTGLRLLRRACDCQGQNAERPFHLPAAGRIAAGL